jgi:glycyl-tRNA synthetase beta subunit
MLNTAIERDAECILSDDDDDALILIRDVRNLGLDREARRTLRQHLLESVARLVNYPSIYLCTCCINPTLLLKA